jgi:hypothetical protein
MFGSTSRCVLPFLPYSPVFLTSSRLQIPASYIASHHPLHYASISPDARLIAVSGQKGLTHYNALSGRWKLFEQEKEEEAIQVKGGMAWWGSTLIVGCEVEGQYQVRPAFSLISFASQSG